MWIAAEVPQQRGNQLVARYTSDEMVFLSSSNTERAGGGEAI